MFLSGYKHRHHKFTVGEVLIIEVRYSGRLIKVKVEELTERTALLRFLDTNISSNISGTDSYRCLKDKHWQTFLIVEKLKK